MRRFQGDPGSTERIRLLHEGALTGPTGHAEFIEAAYDMVDELLDEVLTLQSTIADKDDEIEKVERDEKESRDERDDAKTERDEALRDLKAAEERAEELEGDLDVARDRIRHLEAELEGKDAAE